MSSQINLNNGITGIKVTPYRKNHESAVKDFNYRLEVGGATEPNHRFPTSYNSEWIPHLNNRDIFEDHFLAIDEDGVVRGGYIIKHQMFYILGKLHSITQYRLPISEGIIDKKFMMVGVLLYKNAIKDYPNMYGLGGGGPHQPSQRFIIKARWKLHPVPFYFKILKPNNFLKNIYLRKNISMGILLYAARFTGLGYLFIKLLNITKTRNNYKAIQPLAEEVDEFGSWANDIWNECKSQYSYIAVRDSKTLNLLYTNSPRNFIRLKIMKDDEIVGWSVLLAEDLKGHNYFGNLTLGSIVDCLSLKNHEEDVIFASTILLQSLGVDLIVSNQSFNLWQKSMQLSGYLKGPTNFYFASSPELKKLLHPYQKNIQKIHMVRGDGDGPVNLFSE